MTCRRSPCTFSSRVIGQSSQSGPLQGVVTLGTIGQMALTLSGHKCQHYSDSVQSSRSNKPLYDGLLILADPVFNASRSLIIGFARDHKIPTVFQLRDYVDGGGLISYGPNEEEIYDLSSRYLAKILQGTKPADLPVEQPTKFQLVINLKTAKALGLTIPPALLARADQVIE